LVAALVVALVCARSGIFYRSRTVADAEVGTIPLEGATLPVVGSVRLDVEEFSGARFVSIQPAGAWTAMDVWQPFAVRCEAGCPWRVVVVVRDWAPRLDGAAPARECFWAAPTEGMVRPWWAVVRPLWGGLVGDAAVFGGVLWVGLGVYGGMSRRGERRSRGAGGRVRV
jgi:hypothetical protein